MISWNEIYENTVILPLEFNFYDLWLWIYNFSKLKKLSVNLAISNDRVFQMPINYIKGLRKLLEPMFAIKQGKVLIDGVIS